MYWGNVIINLLRRKNIWGYVTGVEAKPSLPQAQNFDLSVDTWETYNSKANSWINNSVIQSIGMQLEKYETTKEV